MNPALKLKYCKAIVNDQSSARFNEPCFRISTKRNGYCNRHQNTIDTPVAMDVRKKFITKNINHMLEDFSVLTVPKQIAMLNASNFSKMYRTMRFTKTIHHNIF